MANKRFSGVLRDPVDGLPADRDRYRFTHTSTTGEVIRGSTSYIRIGEDGAYDFTLEYGNITICSYSELGRRWINQGNVTINSDTIVTTLPALLLATTPATPDLVLQLEQILEDAQQATTDAQQAASDAQQSATEAQQAVDSLTPATESQAIEGTDNDSYMTSLRTKQSIEANTGSAAPLDVIDDPIDSAEGKVLVTGAGGLLGESPVVADANNAPLGVLGTSGQTTNGAAVLAGFPDLGAGSNIVYWNIQTTGTANRQTQIAWLVSQDDNQDTQYIRSKYNGVWSEWRLVNGLSNLTTMDLINGSFPSLNVGDTITTVGFYGAGDGGDSQWVLTSETGTPSQTPVQMNDGAITDSMGRLFKLAVFTEVVPYALGANGKAELDDTDVLMVSAEYARTTCGVLHITSGEYLLENPVRDFRFYGDIKIFGDGIGNTILRRSDNATTSTPMFFTPDGASATEYIEIRDLSVRNRWAQDGDFATLSNNTVSIVNCKKVIVENIEVSYSGAGSLVTTDCDDVVVNNCRVLYSARDGIRVVNATSARVTNNYLRSVLDDAIATPFASDSSVGRIDGMSIITGNEIVDSQGIIALGNKSTIISNNILKRPMVRGIRAAADVFGSGFGATPTYSVTITNNIITDLFGGAVFNWADYSEGIFVETFRATAKDDIEAYNGSEVVPPYGHLYVDDIESAGTANPGAYNLTIQGNKVVRTLQPTSKYSDYGFGKRFTADGYIDPEITLSDMCENALLLSGTFRDSCVNHNVFSGSTRGVYLWGGIDTLTDTVRNLVLSDNIFSNMQSEAMLLNGSGIITLDNNVFDLDPYFENPNRNSDGTWLTGNSPQVFASQTSGITPVMNSCTFKNLKRIHADDGLYRAKNSIFHCDPLNDTGDIVNKGIGVLPNMIAHANCTNIIDDGDPTSAGFRRIKNVCRHAQAALPTSGVYVKGYILKTNDVNNSFTGWLRLTTGDEHVLGVDWKEI